MLGFWFGFGFFFFKLIQLTWASLFIFSSPAVFTSLTPLVRHFFGISWGINVRSRQWLGPKEQRPLRVAGGLRLESGRWLWATCPPCCCRTAPACSRHGAGVLPSVLMGEKAEEGDLHASVVPYHGLALFPELAWGMQACCLVGCRTRLGFHFLIHIRILSLFFNENCKFWANLGTRHFSLFSLLGSCFPAHYSAVLWT